jgi:hypothetical protein
LLCGARLPLDDSAAEHLIASVEHDGLAGRDRGDGRVECEFDLSATGG